MRAHFLVYRLISCKSAFDMQPDGVFDEFACFFLGLPLGIAALEGGTNGHKPAILVPLNHNSEFVILHSSTASEDIVPRLRYSDSPISGVRWTPSESVDRTCLLTSALPRERP